MKAQDDNVTAVSATELPTTTSLTGEQASVKKKSWLQRIKSIIWDTLDKSPEERRFLFKLDFFILTWAGFTYFSKNLNSQNLCKCGSISGRTPSTIIFMYSAADNYGQRMLMYPE